jgi:uncharacterized membrane-anchored protein
MRTFDFSGRPLCTHMRPVLALTTLSVWLAPALAAAQQQDPAELYRRIGWVTGSAEVDLGGVATLQVPTGYRFTSGEGAHLFMELCNNPRADELGVLVPPPDPLNGSTQSWFVVFSYDDIGHVADGERDRFDEQQAAAILDVVRQATERDNQERQRRGWTPLHLIGWHQLPFYDASTNDLTWALRASGAAGITVNYDSRVLGRRGVMRVRMIVAEADVAAAVPTYRMIVGGLSFKAGETHAEFRAGDKVAQYGLVGLVTGGAAVAAVKAWKPLVALGALIVAAIGAAAKKLGALFGLKPAAQPAAVGATSAAGASADAQAADTGQASASVLIPCPAASG